MNIQVHVVHHFHQARWRCRSTQCRSRTRLKSLLKLGTSNNTRLLGDKQHAAWLKISLIISAIIHDKSQFLFLARFWLIYSHEPTHTPHHPPPLIWRRRFLLRRTSFRWRWGWPHRIDCDFDLLFWQWTFSALMAITLAKKPL